MGAPLVVTYLLYAVAFGFNLAAAVTVTNLYGRKTIANCRAAMEVCLIFFVALKILVQLFMIERSHAIRAGWQRRKDDRIWLVSVLCCSISTGLLAIVAFMAPLAQIFPESGECRIGLPRKAAMLLMAYDLVVNLCLAGIFLVLLRPILDLRNPRRAENTVTRMESMPSLRKITHQVSLASLKSLIHPQTRAPLLLTSDDTDLPFPRVRVVDPGKQNLDWLARKTIYGALAIMVGTTTNLVALYITQGEHGWVCFMCCMADSKWLSECYV